MGNQSDNRDTLGPVSPKDYTGRFVVPHPIQAGQTLDRIAHIYAAAGFKNSTPIWLYNTKIEKTIGADPNHIRKGVTIFIPRSESGYDLLISRLKAAQTALESSVDQAASEQDRIFWERKAESVWWDLGGDAATTVGSLAFSFFGAAKAARVAKQAVGQAKIAARHAAQSEMRQWAQAFSAPRNRLTKQALTATKAAGVKNAALSALPREKAIDAAAKVADGIRNRLTGDDEGSAFKNGKSTATGYEVWRKAWHGAVTATEFTAEAAAIALDYIEVSTLSDCFVC
jgi:hypothetical protein